MLTSADGPEIGRLAFPGARWFHSLAGGLGRARTLCAQALSLIGETSHPGAEGVVWGNLGYIAHKQRDFREAARCYERAAGIYERLEYAGAQALALCALGDAYQAAGEVPLAHAAWQRALGFLDGADPSNAAELRVKLASPRPFWCAFDRLSRTLWWLAHGGHTMPPGVATNLVAGHADMAGTHGEFSGSRRPCGRVTGGGREARGHGAAGAAGRPAEGTWAHPGEPRPAAQGRQVDGRALGTR